MHCVKCGADVEGTIKGVRLTICCQQCCTPEDEDDLTCVSKEAAKKQFHCMEEDLVTLDYSTRRNPHGRYFSPMKLYLKVEVEHLGRYRLQIKEKKKADREERDRKILAKRQKNLMKKLGEIPEGMNDVLWHFVLGDYLKKAYSMNSKRKDVVMRFSVAPRVLAIMQNCPLAHPGAAIEFCLENPDAGPVEFQELKEKMRMAFRIEGLRILHKLSNEDLDKLRDSPLSAEYQEFKNRDSKQLIRAHLMQELGEKIADQIMHAPACRLRIAIGGEESSVAKKLMDYWRTANNPAERCRKLTCALAAKNLPLFEDNKRCRSFINGTFDCDAEEVVAYIELKRRLEKSHYISPGSFRSEQATEHLDYCLHSLRLDPDDAIERAVKHGLKVRAPRWCCSHDGCDVMTDDSEEGLCFL